MRWRWSKDKMFNEKHNLIITKTNNEYSIYKKQRPEIGDLPSKKAKSIFYKPEYSSGNGTNQMKSIFGNKIFDTPKPINLIEDFLQIATNPNSIILDSFAGSGTTAHAVLNLNKQDGGNRKFILIEMEDYAETITAERAKRVINGYADKKGTGGCFDYYTLGEPLFDENNNLNESVGEAKIREYVWFTETRTTYSQLTLSEAFMGAFNDTAYYFIYEKNKLTTLDYDSLADFVNHKAERYVMYADNCLLPEVFMRAKNIEFKKIPRDITRF
jgi:adenine-specific DNA-methyltransferase